jgi:hypothetical protein
MKHAECDTTCPKFREECGTDAVHLEIMELNDLNRRYPDGGYDAKLDAFIDELKR